MLKYIFTPIYVPHFARLLVFNFHLTITDPTITTTTITVTRIRVTTTTGMATLRAEEV